ncbi:hypothetical protein INR49_020295 [Caranx melampygus]|nr:hypothetical protein INR49_020295 [Caranx melampygus]
MGLATDDARATPKTASFAKLILYYNFSLLFLKAVLPCSRETLQFDPSDQCQKLGLNPLLLCHPYALVFKTPSYTVARWTTPQQTKQTDESNLSTMVLVNVQAVHMTFSPTSVADFRLQTFERLHHWSKIKGEMDKSVTQRERDDWEKYESLLDWNFTAAASSQLHARGWEEEEEVEVDAEWSRGYLSRAR